MRALDRFFGGPPPAVMLRLAVVSILKRFQENRLAWEWAPQPG
jgi:hypothetical protein